MTAQTSSSPQQKLDTEKAVNRVLVQALEWYASCTQNSRAEAALRKVEELRGEATHRKD